MFVILSTIPLSIFILPLWPNIEERQGHTEDEIWGSCQQKTAEALLLLTYPYTKANVDRQTDLNEKGMRAGRPPHAQSLTLILDTNGSLSFSLLYTLSPIVALLNSWSPAVLLPLSFIFLCPLPPFCYPSEAGGLARGWHSQAELRWEIVFTVHTKLHSKSDDWCSWKCLLQGRTSSIVFVCQREYSWQLAIWVKRTCQWRMDA